MWLINFPDFGNYVTALFGSALARHMTSGHG